MLVGLHVPTNFQIIPKKVRKGIMGGGGGASAPQMYRKKSENALWGGGGETLVVEFGKKLQQNSGFIV